MDLTELIHVYQDNFVEYKPLEYAIVRENLCMVDEIRTTELICAFYLRPNLIDI